MGSASSSPADDLPGFDLRLPESGLRFSSQQVRSLNSYVDTLYEEDLSGRMSVETEVAIENLVQRIVDGAGQRDPRFRCCHLIALHRDKKMRSRSLEYLVTLDSLPVLNGSEECRLVEGPVGFGKIRLSGKEADKWAEFTTANGYLCRDKLVERWVQLVAKGACARGGGASRAMSARAAAHAAPGEYCYIEKVSYQASSERRLAIVEGASWVMVRVGPGQDEAKMMLAARVAGCSEHSYTTRVPLTHPLALLHYTAAQHGYYAAAVGPPTSLSIADRSATWQLWNPTLEATLDGHFSDQSTVARIAGALNSLVDKMREGCFQGSAHLLSRYSASCALRHRLQRCAAMRGVSSLLPAAHAAHHLLIVLDNLLHLYERGGPAGFVFWWAREAGARRGTRDAGGREDATAIRNCLMYLHRVAGLLSVGEEIPQTPSEKLELALCGRVRGRGPGGPGGPGMRDPGTVGGGFSKVHLVYLARVARELLVCKNMINYDEPGAFRPQLNQPTSVPLEGVEHLVQLLAVMLDQARDLYLWDRRTADGSDPQLAAYRSKKWSKLKDYYDASSAYLIDAVRRDPELVREDLSDELTVMRHVISWLQKGAKEDKKYLGPVLKPYLLQLHTTAVENSCFLEGFDVRRSSSELDGLKEYCRSVLDGKDAGEGLLLAGAKYGWARVMVELVNKYRHSDFRVVFPTGDGLAVSYVVKLPPRERSQLTLSRRDKAEAKLRLARRCVLAAFNNVMIGRSQSKMCRYESTEEILASVKNGNYWRNHTKPDVIPSSQAPALEQARVRRRSRRSRPVTTYGFPEITITNQSDSKTLRRKYHTLKSLVYSEPVESIKEMKERPQSAGSTVRSKETLSRPTILETLDFINSVKDALSVEESGASDVEESSWSARDEWVVSRASPLGVMMSRGGVLHLALGDLVPAMLHAGKFSTLQELCPRLGPASEGALFALHRLARAARARSAERHTDTWRLPDREGPPEPPQRYRARSPDHVTDDETPPPLPPPPPRYNDRQPQYPDFTPKPLHTDRLDLSRLTLNTNQSFTGVINPLYDIRLPKDSFSVKRTKSIGRSLSTRSLGIDIPRYNLDLGLRKRNDVATALGDTTGETGLDVKNSAYQKYTISGVVGDSYRQSRATID
ncbi:uncharacterized protein LOC116770231 isoform X1 [Danaus plexippus]|uniref:uncharacterized protein LOC116770231 isoform X1 n=1 Tax=Danaus plexippus TaxID=13037 RepID=UPI002AB0BEB8|nr:uncharacterized protein LOC116770231 isoform X1 [Danaus plexippus]XP_061383808.1 uncharacterized protein LOC116770231 isoform X1 [Danaus plexippus]